MAWMYSGTVTKDTTMGSSGPTTFTTRLRESGRPIGTLVITSPGFRRFASAREGGRKGSMLIHISATVYIPETPLCNCITHRVRRRRAARSSRINPPLADHKTVFDPELPVDDGNTFDSGGSRRLDGTQHSGCKSSVLRIHTDLG